MKVLFEYLLEVEIEFENNSECESGVHVGSIYEKTRGRKSRATVPFKNFIFYLLRFSES
jgi:hypothetical protein